jgi:adenylate kinase
VGCEGEHVNIILMGAQGSGKGTQASVLGPELKLVKVATGDLFRAAIAAGNALGQQVEAILARGDLVPDDLTNAIVQERLDQIERQKEAGEVAGALFDGFPRTEAQAEALDRILAAHEDRITVVIELQVDPEKLIDRLSKRRVCSSCGAVYNLEADPPAVEGICDRCGGVLVQREDDQPEPIRRRLALYAEQTAPLLTYYGARGLVEQVDGDQPIAQVTAGIVGIVEQRIQTKVTR